MSATLGTRERRHLLIGLAFLAPNIVGVLIFTVFPVVFAIILALTDWDLTRHNMFKSQPVRFVGFDNFVRLVREDNFLQYLGNTLFLMIGLPFEIAGSLIAAILLSKDPRGGGGKVFRWLIAGAVLLGAMIMLTAVGMHASATLILLAGVACGILLLGVSLGSTAYRTLFYTPFFTSGVATVLLWKKLYNPQTGPINAALRPMLDVVGSVVSAVPAPAVRSGLWIAYALMLGLFAFALHRIRRSWSDGDLGSRGAIIGGGLLALPITASLFWSEARATAWLPACVAVALLVFEIVSAAREQRIFRCKASEGLGNALMLGATAMVGQFILLGLGAVIWNLPAMVSSGPLEPPGWIARYQWAKPAMMILSFWAAIGSNNMLLYLAALQNVPQDLYEAADLDGADRWSRFWHVTWPQLAPVTYFIVVMSVIGGLQGGFEIARVLTSGGPAGATTTLSYFIYLEGFDTGRLGFSAAIAWTLFLMTFVLTILSRKFAAQYVEE